VAGITGGARGGAGTAFEGVNRLLTPRSVDMGTLRSKPGTIAALSLACSLVAAAPAPAATFALLHTFTGGADGGNPIAGLTTDSAGDLFGTAPSGGKGYGTVFELKRSGSGYAFSVLHEFASGKDGAAPIARVVPGPLGHLYGTTSAGGIGGGGTVFELTGTPTPRVETVLYSFKSAASGYGPSSGDLSFDAAGNIYGTTGAGGAYKGGTVYELSPGKSGWTEKVLYNFGRVHDGAVPYAGVIRDAAGNLYGTTSAGGLAGDGTVFELSLKGTGWTETILHSFAGKDDGLFPYAGLTTDRTGNIYGAATDGGSAGGGTIFILKSAAGAWHFQTLFSVPGWGISGPFRTPLVDAAGNILATTHCDGTDSSGSVFELKHVGATWSYDPLYMFTGGSDGQYVFSSPVLDAFGDLAGTTQVGGSGNGVVWKVSP
jgi:uncharacterized repeat protein (TIGR03803 family)